MPELLLPELLLTDIAPDVASLLRSIRPEPRDMRVLAGLAELVVLSAMRPGDRFPAERMLAERLGVGRSTVREALKRWEALGIVERRKGSGTYLRIPITPGSLHMPLTVQLESDSLRRTIEVRRALELEVVPLACARGSAEELARVAETYGALAAAHARNGPSPREDRAFHRAIYDAAHNPLFGQIIEQLHDAFDATFVAPFGDRSFGDDSFPFHADLCAGVIARDAARTRRAIAAIFDVLFRDLARITPT
jgi:GntR family transcriptional regulator, transcriptional repressor for pyruvate dehydrogenase complex